MQELKHFDPNTEIIPFIYCCYCQFCENSNCNVTDIMEKYPKNELTPTQMKEVSEFEMKNIACANHIPNEGFEMFMHKIKIYYKNNTQKEMPGWFSTNKISELWQNLEVKFIDILFTDL